MIQAGIGEFGGAPYRETGGLLAGDVPCLPLNVANKRLGADSQQAWRMV